MIILKLGGSVVTNKTHLYSFRAKTTERLAYELKLSRIDKLILVHGAGSFGHIKASEYKLTYSRKLDEKKSAIARVQHDVRLLNLKIINKLLKAGINAVSLPPSFVITCENGRIKNLQSKIFKTYLAKGYIPVTFGDLVPDRKLLFTICSGDKLMLELAKKFKPEKTIFVMNVNGFYNLPPENKNAKLLPVLNTGVFKKLASSKFVLKYPDVTGGALEKMRISLELTKYSKEVIILNGNVKGRLTKALRGKKIICTKVL